MKCSKRSFAIVSVLFAVPLSLSIGTLNARDAELALLPWQPLRRPSSNA